MPVPVIDLTGAQGRIIDAALALATERAWRDVSLRDIAERAGIGLGDMRQHFSSKADVIAAFVRAVDDAVVAEAASARDEPKRDQLFEIVMARFDALQPYRSALKSIAADSPFDPGLIRALFSSQAWMLEAAGIGADGIEGGMRVAGLAGVYASVYRTWLEDDDPGLARTMAALDRRLRRGERALAMVDEFGRMVRGLGDAAASVLSGARAKRDAARKANDASGPSAEAGGYDAPRQV